MVEGSRLKSWAMSTRVSLVCSRTRVMAIIMGQARRSGVRLELLDGAVSSERRTSYSMAVSSMIFWASE